MWGCSAHVSAIEDERALEDSGAVGDGRNFELADVEHRAFGLDRVNELEKRFQCRLPLSDFDWKFADVAVDRFVFGTSISDFDAVLLGGEVHDVEPVGGDLETLLEDGHLVFDLVVSSRPVLSGADELLLD